MSAELNFRERDASELFSGGVRGILTGFSDTGAPLVDFPNKGYPGAVAAQSTVALYPSDIGKEAVIVFEDHDPGRPIIIGIIKTTPLTPPPPPEISIDGNVLSLTAEREIVLRCGDASITLTRDGKVLIKGSYLLSKSAGVNRVKGGSVELN
jgi:hypothetical protein